MAKKSKKKSDRTVLLLLLLIIILFVIPVFLMVFIFGSVVFLSAYPAISKPPPSKSGFGNIDIAYPWDYTSDGALRFMVDNYLGSPINITAIYVDNIEVNCTKGIPSGWLDSGKKVVIISCDTGIKGKQDDTYAVHLTIMYNVKNGLEGTTTTGTLVGTRS